MKPRLSSALLACLYAVTGSIAFGLRVCRWRRKVIDRFVLRCLPELDAARRRSISAGFYAYLGELVAEVLFERFFDRETLAQRVRVENPEALNGLLDSQRRVLILSAHHANWEWLVLRCSTAFNAPLTAVYTRLKNPWLERKVRGLRGKFGCAMVEAPAAVQYLIEQRGKVPLLAMLADQSPSVKNKQQLWLEFFGQQTSFFQGPGWISAKMGYVPFFAAMRRERRGHYVVRFDELVPHGQRMNPEEILQAYAQRLEQHVREHPESYFWAYNRWKREKPLYG